MGFGGWDSEDGIRIWRVEDQDQEGQIRGQDPKAEPTKEKIRADADSEGFSKHAKLLTISSHPNAPEAFRSPVAARVVLSGKACLAPLDTKGAL